jgi:hypothetical protein
MVKKVNNFYKSDGEKSWHDANVAHDEKRQCEHQS